MGKNTIEATRKFGAAILIAIALLGGMTGEVGGYKASTKITREIKS